MEEVLEMLYCSVFVLNLLWKRRCSFLWVLRWVGDWRSQG